MKRHLFGTVSALLVVGMMAGCATDPTQDLRGGVDRVLVSRTFVDLNVGQVLRMSAKALDAQGNVVPILPTIATNNPAVVSVTIDDTTSGDPLPQTDFQISALTDGSVEITAMAGGVTSDPTDVVVFPTQFNGTVVLDATGAVDVLTLSSTTNVKFDPDASEVLVDGSPTVLLSRTADEMQVAVISATALTDVVVTVEDLVFQPPYATFDIASLDAPDGVDIRTALFDGAISVDAAPQADYVTLAASAGFEFAANAEVLIDGDPTFIVSRSATQLVVAGSNIDAVSGGEVTIENALYLGLYDVASIVAATTVNLEAFDNSVMTDAIGTAPELSAGPFPLVFWGLVEDASPDMIVRFSPGADLTMSSTVDWATSATDIDVFYTDAGDGFVDCLGCGSGNPETGTWTVTGGDTNYFYVELWSGDPTVFRVTITSP